MSDSYAEALRPQFHFTAKEGWINDPNGLVYYEGDYHLFFQHNPLGTEWGNMTWGHAVSRDMVHWEQLPNAIEPDELGTIFSGSAVVDWGNTSGLGADGEPPIVAMYTAAGKPFTQCIAYSVDKGRSWIKYAHNPVVKQIIGENRDPKVVLHKPSGKWIAALFLDGNAYTFLNSPNLIDWTRIQDITVADCSECPDFFEIPVDGNPGDTRWVWTAANGHYLVGRFDGERFTPEIGPIPSDVGANFYAVQTYSDIPETDGRRIQVAWMAGGQFPDMPFNQQMSFPCELTLRAFPEGLRICRTPVSEIESLYEREHRWNEVKLFGNVALSTEVTTDLLDISLVLKPMDGDMVIGVAGQEIVYSASDSRVTCLGRSADLPAIDGVVELRALVDRTSIELFGNDGRVSMSSCFVPSGVEDALSFSAVNGRIEIVSATVHTLRSAWE